MGKKFFASGACITDSCGKILFRLQDAAEFNDKFFIAHARSADGRDCFLKFASRDSSAGNLNNLIREGNFRFSYPFIEQVYGNFTGVDPDGDQIYGVSVEYIQGKSLTKFRRELNDRIAKGEISEIEAEKVVFRQMLEFLYGMNYYIQYAGKSYFHRDLKPDNIMITKSGVVKIVDFDFAHITESSKTITSLGWDLPFSLGFTSPAARYNAGKWKMPGFPEELYAAGRLLFFWLNGRTYYTDEQIINIDPYTGEQKTPLYCEAGQEELGFGSETNQNRYQKRYLGSRYIGIRRILNRMCLSPAEKDGYHSVKEVIQDYEQFLTELYGTATDRDAILKLQDLPLLKENKPDPQRRGVMVSCKVDQGPRKGKVLYEYSMRDIYVGKEKIMTVYNVNQEIYYMPVYGKEIQRLQSHGEAYRVYDGDVFLYQESRIEFMVVSV